ncbi:hypothetical protein AAG906_021146 [Vitis piasezkii]
MGGPITSTIREVEIRLDPESICRIFDIAPVGLRVYESKMWPIVSGFEPREAIKRIFGLLNAHGMGKPSVHSLTINSLGTHMEELVVMIKYIEDRLEHQHEELMTYLHFVFPPLPHQP